MAFEYSFLPVRKNIGMKELNVGLQFCDRKLFGIEKYVTFLLVVQDGHYYSVGPKVLWT